MLRTCSVLCAAVALAVAGCSTGVQEADRAIFVNACAAATGGTQAACACAFDDISSSGGSGGVLNETIDELQQGKLPERVTRAVARCSSNF